MCRDERQRTDYGHRKWFAIGLLSVALTLVAACAAAPFTLGFVAAVGGLQTFKALYGQQPNLLQTGALITLLDQQPGIREKFIARKMSLVCHFDLQSLKGNR